MARLYDKKHRSVGFSLNIFGTGGHQDTNIQLWPHESKVNQKKRIDAAIAKFRRDLERHIKEMWELPEGPDDSGQV